jgi:hypothetical protein
MVTIKDIAWAAGIYEGEGTFGGHSVRVVQKDNWLIYRLKYLFGGTVTEYNGYHYWTISGPLCRGFLLTIFTFLSPRRKEQVTRHLLFFKDPNFLPSNFCPNGHEYTEENTYIERGHGREWRTCRICRKEKYDRKNKARNEKYKNPEYQLVVALAKGKGIPFDEAEKLLQEKGSERCQ